MREIAAVLDGERSREFGTGTGLPQYPLAD